MEKVDFKIKQQRIFCKRTCPNFKLNDNGSGQIYKVCSIGGKIASLDIYLNEATFSAINSDGKEVICISAIKHELCEYKYELLSINEILSEIEK